MYTFASFLLMLLMLTAFIAPTITRIADHRGSSGLPPVPSGENVCAMSP